MKDLPTVEYLRYALSLDVDSGLLRWNYREDMPGNWNTRYVGKLALNADKGQGYRSGTVNGIRLLAHRVVWAIYYGNWPEGELDHVNGIGSDNRITNLRIVTRSQNCYNIIGKSKGRKKFKGVFWYKKYSCWVVKITSNRKQYHVGYYFSEVEAAMAYDNAAIRLHGEYAKTNAAMGLLL